MATHTQAQYVALVAALRATLSALQELASNPAFSDDAPEFNAGGVGYEACEQARMALNGVKAA